MSGLFTFLGVRKTLTAQEKKDKVEFRERYRTIIELQEIYNGDLMLRNLKHKSGRLIITPQYQYAISRDLSDGSFNYIEIHNSKIAKAFNCVVKVEIRLLPENLPFMTEVRIPIIFENEKVYIPIDKIHDDNNVLLDNKKYIIKHIDVEYETYAKETIKIVRHVNSEVELEKRISIDEYSIKSDENSDFIPLYEVKGTKNEWYFLRDID
ncbi:hypothetical protein CN504_13635 [Bacillus anthracis]|uniref:hypothetical protein n=1 Tax=Bacillus tropicus TaxID=2026188 RepID=UPI000BF7AB66|nr:hypothetical protein [Bacillus tropicus]MCU5002919.1 hypothetical protein [Bacillus tropicus]PES83449.1 hypothetical protein CN504_13635 [Bacillus anthracis]